jgi:hypothetical protein
MSRAFKAHCKIFDYVEKVEPDLAKVIRGICADGALVPLKGKVGVTFLMPQDKAYIKSIVDLAYSGNPDDIEKAHSMVCACIIRDVLKKPADWMAHRDDIPNSLYPSQHVEVESASSTEVTFKSGAKATPDPGFVDASKRKNLAVWKLTGVIPITTDKPSTGKYSKGVKKTGGYTVDDLATQKERFKISLAVENAYTLACLQKSPEMGNVNPRNVYVQCTLSLVNYLLNVVRDESTVIEKVLPLISLDAIDFYLLVEPHRCYGEPLIDDITINNWWKWRATNPSCDCHAIVKQIQDLLDAQKSTALIYSGRQKIEAAKQDAVGDVCGVIGSKPRASPVEIRKLYEALENNNTIKSAGPIFPESLAAFYKKQSGLKEIQDELRYVTFGWFNSLETGTFDIGRFNEIVNFIGECQHACTPEERLKSLRLLNEMTLKFQIEPQDKIEEIQRFVCSSMFLFTPLTEKECNTGKFKRPHPKGGPRLGDQQKDLYADHARLLGRNVGDDSRIMAVLRSLDPNSLPEELRHELKMKFNSC